MIDRRFLLISDFAELKKEGERLKVIKGSHVSTIPIRYIEAIVVMGRISFTGEAINLALRSNVPVFFMSKFGKPKGLLIPQLLTSKYNARLKQYEIFKKNRPAVAGRIILEKISNIEKNFNIELNSLKSQIKKAETLESIMGVEGIASRAMFEKFKENIKGSRIEFNGRNYYPPADRTNALLSLAYTFTYFLALPLIIFMGYDPYISFLHSKRGKHLSFCSDIVEPVRPLVTKKLETPIITEVFSKKDFIKENNGFYLKKESLPKFLNWFESIKEDVIISLKSSILLVEEIIR